MVAPIGRKTIFGALAITAIAAAYVIYLFQESIPEIAGFNIASVIIASLLGGAAGALLAVFGIDTSGSVEGDA